MKIEEPLGVLSEIDWSQLIEILKLVASPLGAIFGAFLGSYLASYWAEKRRNRRGHFDRLKSVIFTPWRSELHPFSYNLEHCIQSRQGHPLNVDSHPVSAERNVLFEDVKNHFPDLFHEWAIIKQRFSEYHHQCLLFTNEIKEMLAKKTELPILTKWERKEKGIMQHFVKETYDSLIDLVKTKRPSDKKLEITPTEDICRLRIDNTLLAQGSREEMEKCKFVFKELLEIPEYKRRAEKLIGQAGVLTKDVKKFELKLDQITETTKLPGNCSYI